MASTPTWPARASRFSGASCRRLDKNLTPYPADPKGAAGRDVSGKVLNPSPRTAVLLGGSADRAPSTKTRLPSRGPATSLPTTRRRNFHFGIREHAMGAVLNVWPCPRSRLRSGFMIFSDYMRPQIRLSALMELPVVYVFTHDSIGVGEDGPTHQPIEQLPSLRAIPGLITLRPGDANEVVEAWKLIMQLKHEPVALILSRQAMPTLDRTKFAPAAGLAKGAYVLGDTTAVSPPDPDGPGTVGLAVSAWEARQGRVRPAWSHAVVGAVEHQDQAYRDSVLPPRDSARGHRAGVELRRHRYSGSRRRRRHDDVRRVRPLKEAEEVRVHRRGGGRRRQEAAGQALTRSRTARPAGGPSLAEP